VDAPPPRSPDGPAGENVPPAILSLVAVLQQLDGLIDRLTDGQYQARPVAVATSSIGAHVRHCLDHVDALLAGVERGALDYDRRQRGTDVETDRRAALGVLRRQQARLLALPANAVSRPLRLSVTVSSVLPPLEVASSVGRELAFVLSHTIHHNALVAVVARSLGATVCERFGYAPSTLAHLDRTAAVRQGDTR
jgi:hypothetical protein